MAVADGRAGHCWGCGGVGYRIAKCPRRSLPVAEADGSFSRGLFGGGLERGGGDMEGVPGSKGRPLWRGSVLGYVKRSRGPVGGAPLGAR